MGLIDNVIDFFVNLFSKIFIKGKEGNEPRIQKDAYNLFKLHVSFFYVLKF